ncbi:MAG: RHS repeat-associated core domain-containing protein, partial [Myxococcota bacterium]
MTRESQPSYDVNGSGFTTMGDYDALGRLGRKVVDRTGESAAYSELEFRYTYRGLQTDISIQNTLQASRTYSTQGLLLETVDTMGGRTRFAHDGLGELVAIEDAAGNVTMAKYDDLGQRTWVNDPNRGRTSFEYSGAGEVVSQTDANQNTIETDYDQLGRPTERRVDDVVVATWSYDPVGARGLIGSESVPGEISRIIRYDALTRLQKVESTIDGETLTTLYGYDTVTGKQKGVKMPSGRIIGTHQTVHGYPLLTFDASRSSSSQFYRRVLDVDARGNIVEAEFGNGLKETRFFFPSTGQLAQLCVTRATEDCHPLHPSGEEIQRIDYVYDDPYGNLTMELDAVHRAQESFQYDDLQRVTAASRSWDGAPGASPQTTNYRYDAVGNVLQKDDYGALGAVDPYVYGTSSRSVRNAGPHAVLQVTKRDGSVASFSYDANGNQTNGDGRTLHYTYFNLPEEIESGSSRTLFRYGPNHQRYRQEEISAGASSIKLYADSYERVTANGLTTQRDYLEDFAIIEMSGGSTAVRYVHRDRLGSVDTITDASGAVFEEHNFGPFGAPRAGNKTDNGALLASAVTERGFTDHEHLDSHRLIHMNGRMYDPRLGRFLSVDPFIAAPNSNGLNPYSYVMNNPLMATDPSGFVREFTTGSGWVDFGISFVPGVGTAVDLVNVGLALTDSSATTGDVLVAGGVALAGLVPFGKQAGNLLAPVVKRGIDSLVGSRAAKGVVTKAARSGDEVAESASRKATPGGNKSSGGDSSVKGQNTGKTSPGEVDGATGKCFVAGTLVAVAALSIPIEALAVGDRVSTFSGSSETFVDDSWQRIDVELTDNDDVHVSFLRPMGWLEANGVSQVGESLYIALPELGIAEQGEIRFISGANIKSGPGRVVLSAVTQR